MDEKGDFARLLETERRLEQRLRRARAEAEALVAEARASVAEREAALAAELAAAERDLAVHAAAERQREEQSIADAARRTAEAYDRMPEERVAAVVRLLGQRLVTGSRSP